MTRRIEDFLSDKAVATDHTSGTTLRHGKVVGFGESEGRKRVASSDMSAIDRFSYSISGQASHCENDTLDACRILATRLRLGGLACEDPVESQLPHIDAVLELRESTSVKALQIQVVRAVVDQKLWKDLAQSGSVDQSNVPVESAVQMLANAISLKLRKIDDTHRPQITLLLNSIETPFMCFDAVLEQFQQKHGAWLENQGFNQVWLVGPDAQLTFRLDDPRT